MRLIKKEESSILFDMQESIIKDEMLGNVEKKCKLAILNTFEPIYDYYTAYDMLNEQKYEMNYTSNLIGAYLGAVWVYDKPNEMLKILSENINRFDNEKQAIVKYIEALEKFYRGINYMEDIKKSLDLCDSICAPYLLLLQNGNYHLMRKDVLISKIIKNVSVRDVGKIELVETELFIQYYICRSVLSDIELNNILV